VTPTAHVFIGTKAQYIKTAPLLRLLVERGIPYRLIDSGQHAALACELREELHTPDPDVRLGGAADITTIRGAIAWSLGLARRLVDRRELAAQLFAGQPGICVVHGDTPSTLLAALLARRAGLEVAHLEAGLRSRRLLHPFPEELIRRAVMRMSALLFAPDDEAITNLRRRRLPGRIVPTPGNTVVDALRWSLGDHPVAPVGPAIATMHRVENLHRRDRVRGFLQLLLRMTAAHEVTFVVHGPTEAAIAPHRERLAAAGIEVVTLRPHAEFTRMLASAPLVITDGGSVQEECALLGVPTLLWRAETERPDGLGANVVLSRYDPELVSSFLAAPDRWRRVPATAEARPTEVILTELQRHLEGAAEAR
jgi:UDP-N-acetylglucosamine 2-epimerase (non-hydrolysing)